MQSANPVKHRLPPGLRMSHPLRVAGVQGEPLPTVYRLPAPNAPFLPQSLCTCCSHYLEFLCSTPFTGRRPTTHSSEYQFPTLIALGIICNFSVYDSAICLSDRRKLHEGRNFVCFHVKLCWIQCMYLGKIFQTNERRNKYDYYWELIFTDHFL